MRNYWYPVQHLAHSSLQHKLKVTTHMSPGQLPPSSFLWTQTCEWDGASQDLISCGPNFWSQFWVSPFEPLFLALPRPTGADVQSMGCLAGAVPTPLEPSWEKEPYSPVSQTIYAHTTLFNGNNTGSSWSRENTIASWGFSPHWS